MKKSFSYYLKFLVIFTLCSQQIWAQRRTAPLSHRQQENSSLTVDNGPSRPVTRSRGRARFVLTDLGIQVSPSAHSKSTPPTPVAVTTRKTTGVNTSSRRLPPFTSTVSTLPVNSPKKAPLASSQDSTASYEVRETIQDDNIPIGFRKPYTVLMVPPYEAKPSTPVFRPADSLGGKLELVPAFSSMITTSTSAPQPTTIRRRFVLPQSTTAASIRRAPTIAKNSTSSDVQPRRIRTRISRPSNRQPLSDMEPINSEHLEVLPLFLTESMTVRAGQKALNKRPTGSASTSTAIKTEAVVSHVTEVTSKRTVKRLKANRPVLNRSRNQIDGLKRREDEQIDANDNYPDAFKAQLQIPLAMMSSSSTEKVQPLNAMNSTTVQPQRQQPVEDVENELDAPRSSPVPLVVMPKRRPSIRPKFTKVPSSPRPFTSISNSEQHQRNNTSSVAVPYKPKRILFSSRKNKTQLEQITTTTDIPSYLKNKPNVYSARYRSDQRQGTLRTSTNAPVYLPTVPSVSDASRSGFSTTVSSDYVWPHDGEVEFDWSFSH